MVLSRAEIRKLLPNSQYHTYAAGEFLFRQGEVGQRLYLIQRGTVEIMSEVGERSQTIARRGKGEIIGEMALLDSGLRGASALAVNNVRARSIDKQSFDALLAESPARLLQVTQLLTQRMRSMQAGLMPADSSEPRVGHPFGPYLLLAELGRGGMGVVYQALERSQDRLLALKLIQTSQEETRQRFKTECALLEKLDHPNIVSMHSHGEIGQHLFLAMELLLGQTLQDRLRSGPLALDEVGAWFCPVVEALAHAQQLKIAHRDVKPGNIFRCQDSQIKVLDFGLARHEEAAHITTVGLFLGTANYLAPERIGGSYRGAELASDQYSLGATLYEAVTGKPPFVDNDPLVVLLHHANSRPLRPALTRTDLPESLEKCILRLLSKQPEDRYGSMEDALEALASSCREIPDNPGAAASQEDSTEEFG